MSFLSFSQHALASLVSYHINLVRRGLENDHPTVRSHKSKAGDRVGAVCWVQPAEIVSRLGKVERVGRQLDHGDIIPAHDNGRSLVAAGIVHDLRHDGKSTESMADLQ